MKILSNHIPIDLSVSTAWPDNGSDGGKDTAHSGTLIVCSRAQRGFEEAKSGNIHKPSQCQLATDLEYKGLQVVYTTLEVGALGHYRPQAVKT